MDLQQRVAESKKQILDRMQKLELDQKLSVSKEKLQSMKREQHLDKTKKELVEPRQELQKPYRK
jgi:hypothetical protein